MKTILTSSFFDRTVLEVCPELLGKFLVTKNWSRMITEIEAYDWIHDLASHARHGKTSRNAPMFGEPWHRYVYLIYGMYQMLNIVTWPWNHPSAILIRGVEWYDWPGKLTKNLCIDKTFNGKIATQKTWLWIEDRGVIVDQNQIKTTTRVWIDYAWERAKKEWRFIFK